MMAPRAGTDLSGATCVLGRVNGAGASTYEPRCSVERVSFQKRKDAGSASKGNGSHSSIGQADSRWPWYLLA